MSNLPPGVTDEMCEGGPVQYCAECGHADDCHDDDESQACGHINCDCNKYVEGEYDGDIDEDQMKGL